MPRVTLIYPAIGRKPGESFVRSWQLQPLGIARLAAMTPPEWRVTFMDDRVEPIDFDVETDVVGISIETYSAKRGYHIAARFRARGIPVVLGGYHATLCPDEAAEHADAVCVGEAEGVRESILGDAGAGPRRKSSGNCAGSANATGFSSTTTSPTTSPRWENGSIRRPITAACCAVCGPPACSYTAPFFRVSPRHAREFRGDGALRQGRESLPCRVQPSGAVSQNAALSGSRRSRAADLSAVVAARRLSFWPGALQPRGHDGPRHRGWMQSGPPGVLHLVLHIKTQPFLPV